VFAFAVVHAIHLPFTFQEPKLASAVLVSDTFLHIMEKEKSLTGHVFPD